MASHALGDIMESLRRALLSGLLVWLVPFVVAVLVFPIRESNRPLFESIMPVTVALVVSLFGLAYFVQVRGAGRREGLLLGILWMVISLLIDAPLMLFGGPMKMPPAGYAADIGLTYLIIPIVPTALGLAVEKGQRNQ
jgi:hypothetical protein